METLNKDVKDKLLDILTNITIALSVTEKELEKELEKMEEQDANDFNINRLIIEMKIAECKDKHSVVLSGINFIKNASI